YGTFFYTQKSSIISMVDLPTTDIIEPFFSCLAIGCTSCFFSFGGVNSLTLIIVYDFVSFLSTLLC
ncbi:hypothetical protein EI999_10060, partial [Streptococcus suis]